MSAPPSDRWMTVIKAIGYPFGVVVGVVWLAILVDGTRDILGLTDPLEGLLGEDESRSEALRNTAQAYALRVAALAGLLAAPIVGVRIWILNRQTTAAEAQAETAAKGHITDRFSKAIEQLGAKEMAIRLGAIYALEQVARDSWTYHIPVMETLCAFIRVNAPASMAPEPLPPWDADLPNDADEETRKAYFTERFGKASSGVSGGLSNWLEKLDAPRVDIQAALTVIGRRVEEHIAKEREGDRPFALDLRNTCLIRADLSKARLDHALLTGAHLEGANLEEAHLEGANLRRAHLEGANLGEAHLEGSDLWRAHLERAVLRQAHLEGAKLGEAHLEGAYLGRAHLERAVLEGAHLEEAILWQAHLEGANLRRAHLEGAVLEGAHLNSTDLRDWTIARTSLRSVDFTEAMNFDRDSVNHAFGVKAGEGLTKLPDNDPPDHWHDATKDGSLDAYYKAYRAWLAGTGKTDGGGA